VREHLGDRPVRAVRTLRQLTVGQRLDKRAERVVGVPQGLDEWRGVVLQRASPFWVSGADNERQAAPRCGGQVCGGRLRNTLAVSGDLPPHQLRWVNERPARPSWSSWPGGTR